jgi:hypothetical protein
MLVMGSTVVIYVVYSSLHCHNFNQWGAHLKEFKVLLQCHITIRTDVTLTEESLDFVVLLLRLNKGMDFVKTPT